MSKKKDKRVAHAQMVWERAQLAAATAVEQIDKSLAAVEQYKDELTDEQIEQIRQQVLNQQTAIKEFLLEQRNKYVAKLDEFNLEPLVEL